MISAHTPIGFSSESSFLFEPNVEQAGLWTGRLSFAGVVDAPWGLVGFCGGVFLDMDVLVWRDARCVPDLIVYGLFSLVRFHDM